ncbi:MAG: N-acetylmuramoyl-L-alanine amidase [Candidatus Hydrogenedentota bacterium]
MVSSLVLLRCVCVVFLAVLQTNPKVFAAETKGASVTFKVSVADEPRTATIELRKIGDVAYVPINAVIHQFGGGANILSGRAQFDFLGKTAWVRLDGRSVNASRKQFQVRHTVVRDRTDILMALTDIVPFFEDAFGVNVSQEVGISEKPEERIREPKTVVMEDLDLPDKPAEETPLADFDPITRDRPAKPKRIGPINVIVIDAGHGGVDVGCQSAAIVEKDLTLAIARRTARVLQASFEGRVMLTRSQDANPALKARARLANAQKADLLVSIHAGAGFSPFAQGFEIFVPPDARLSAALGKPETEATGASLYAAQSADIAAEAARKLTEATGATNRGIRRARCRLFDEVDMPCILLEVGCLTNHAEASKLAEEGYQMKIAQGLAEGILEYARGLAANGATP